MIKNYTIFFSLLKVKHLDKTEMKKVLSYKVVYLKEVIIKTMSSINTILVHIGLSVTITISDDNYKLAILFIFVFYLSERYIFSSLQNSEDFFL